MSSSKKDIITRIVMAILCILTIAFIFSNSMKVGVDSQAVSDGVVSNLASFFQFFGLSYETSSFITRKMGHLLEYALLGLIICGNILLYSTKFSNISWSLLLSLLVAVFDEYIQSFVPGRSSQVSDILIDFTGILIGVAIMYLLYLLFTRPQRKYEKKYY